MRFACEKNTLLRELTIAQDIISSRNSLSILSNVLLEARDERLIIRATDLKVGFETEIPIELSEPGSTTVFCDKFSSIIRALPDGEVEFEQTDDRLVIKPRFKKIDFQLKCIASDKYPALQDTADEAYFQLPQSDLIAMIAQTIFAVSDDETRYFMNGVYLEHQGGKLAMVATDGRRLSYISREIGTTIKDFDPVIIPPKILSLIRKLSSGEGNLSLAVTDKNVFLRFDGLKVSSNLIEGQFPNYTRVIPESQDFRIIVNRGELIDALQRVSLLVEQKSRRIYFTVRDNTITLNSEESEIGVAKEELACTYEGPETAIALNYRYLIEPLKVMECESICIQFSDSKKAISLLPEPEEDYIHIVAPMQLD